MTDFDAWYRQRGRSPYRITMMWGCYQKRCNSESVFELAWLYRGIAARFDGWCDG